ncbi:MAG: pyrroline-5-carboxylate reductase [Chloroflexi bacterium]|nr:pyrroline-5-carboxylate reductase [Chloroflexota bacterium]MDE2806486.1 pyrroline-5-carboxylate reductase [Gemmatimonadota bacterium]
MTRINKVAILGGGNLGGAIARGFVASGFVEPGNVVVTRRRVELLGDLAAEGFHTLSDNHEAVQGADVVILCVQPQQMEELLESVGRALDARRQVVISTATGMSIADIRRWVGSEVPVLRAMPNLGIAIGESMTCLAADEASVDAVPVARAVFDVMGSTLVIREDQMTSATALCACGIAFFLRAIRAASQGGIEIGFHADEALQLASQTAKGAAALLLSNRNHPEMEIDKVTTPQGCTISGLNEMENRGFSSAMVRGIIRSADKAGGLYRATE